MMRKFDIKVVPNGERDVVFMDGLEQEVIDYTNQHGNQTCATLAQLKFWDDEPATVNGRLYTGEVAKYINKCIKKARSMQDEQDRVREGHTQK
ncbi:hypothetical protein LCGC14_2643200 [marine sediment metagenome]|uniref:Uncharacterized protein n=1 Tax=marine sediment metagenome TaxID=412755 RepID=A0A0F9C7Q8_9ZZZZ